MKNAMLVLLLSLPLTTPSYAQFAVEETDDTGVLNPADFSWRYYREQMERFPERLGIVCYNAYLVDKGGNHDEGLMFFRECAERGNPAAMVYLASFYEMGNGTERDYRKAAHWLRKAAETGYANGQYHYGMALLAGHGLSRDSEAGKSWIEKAAAQGHSDAIKLISEGYRIDSAGQ